MIKVIKGMSIVLTTTFIILFVELGILLTSFPQFVYAQTAENEIIENTLETVEKATTEGLSEIKESVSNASKAIEDSTNNTSDRFILQNQTSEFKDSTRNLINGESDKLSFNYPSNWDVNVSDNRFDNYELIFTDKTSKSSIRVSDEAIKTTNKIFLTANDPQGYFDIYMMENSPLPSSTQKIDTYPKGKVTIAGLPSYSELFLDDKEYAVLISIAFQEGNDRHYTVISEAPSPNYDKLEPTILEIIKSISPKILQKTPTGEFEISSNDTHAGDKSNKKQPSFMITQNKKESNILQKEKTLISTKKPNEDLTTGELVNETKALVSISEDIAKSNNTLGEEEGDQDPDMFLNKLLNPSTTNASALGNDQAKITIVEFADYQCPFCAQFNKETKNSILKNFVDTGKAKFLYKDSHCKRWQ